MPGISSIQERKERKEYKSPLRKLVVFFKKSRDKWKAKCREAKAKIKYLNNRVRDLEKSREQWKQKAKKIDRELKRFKAELETNQKELKRLKVELEVERSQRQKLKKRLKNIEIKTEIFQIIPSGHQYSLGQIMWFISFVFSAAISFRAASAVMQIISDYWAWPIKVPSWQAGRLWVLRLGCYKLMRTKKKAGDWV